MRGNRERVIRLMRALNRIDDRYYRLQRDQDIKESLFALLYACCSDDRPLSQKNICEEWCIPRTTLNTTVKEQVKLGNVELVPRGNKEKTVQLTEQGQVFAESILGLLFDIEERLAEASLHEGLVADLESYAAQFEQALEQGKAARKGEKNSGK